MSDELGADARLVAFMQYARVLIVVLTAPLIVALFLGGSDGAAPGLGDPDGAGWPADLAYAAGACAGGLGLARLLPLPAGSVLLPMMVAAVLSGTGLAGTPASPPSSRTSPSPSSASRSACASRRRRCARRAACCPPCWPASPR